MMKNPTKDQARVSDKTQLLLAFNYNSSFLALIFGLLCLYVMQITRVIPYVFFTYFILNLVNVFIYKRHRHLTAMALITSFISLISTLVITLFSGGTNSPFIFVFAIIVLAGYISTKVFGKIYQYSILAIITLVYILDLANFNFISDVVPESSKIHFSFGSLLFSIYLLGEIFGRGLLKAYRGLYKAKREIESKIHEKENLLKEVHHRVKNNLQTISSLLSLQSRNSDDKGVKNLLKSSQNRVISMAMIHEMLYLREDISKIEYGSYVQDLVAYLVRSIKGTGDNITINIDISEIRFNIDTAIPLGLLVNEAVTNALKYGILDDSKGEIFIQLKKGISDDYVLHIGDNGVGYPEDLNYKNSKSLGLKLIHNLARQLHGSVMRDRSKKGTHYILKFKEIKQEIPKVA